MVLAPLWAPSPARVEAATLWRLRELIRERHGADLPRDYRALHRWSVEHPGEFWAAVWDLAAVPGERGERLLEQSADPRPAGLSSARFLPDARLNVAEALLSRRGTEPALLFTGEDGEHTAFTWDELRTQVARVHDALRADGVGPGDRVAAIVTNRPEGYILMIATASLGAVFTSVSPDFGAPAVLDRLAQVRPSVLVGVSRYFYAGRDIDVTGTLAEVAEGLPELRRAVALGGPPPAGDGRWTGWEQWLAGRAEQLPPLRLFPFDHPWYLLYSSGTTGRPKCILHRAGGVLLKHLAEHQLQHDLSSADRLCFFTTAGWMMWNWQASALASGVSLVLYDGSPAHPTSGRLFAVAEQHRVTALGTSPRYLDSCAQAGLRPADEHDLTALRTLLVTGSPLPPETYYYVYDAVAPDAHLASVSGGTDLCGVILGADPTGPVYAGQLQAPALGMDVDVVDENGAPQPVGARGELVVRTAFPSMPLGFWGDDDGSRYRAAYFERFPGMWHHGDFTERTAEGGFVITGRSDATLNPAGVRIGTAEIYRQVTAVPGVRECVAVGLERDGDVVIALFVTLADGLALDDELRAAIRERVRRNLSPRHLPALIHQVPDLPRTRSGKLSELAVRDVVHGRPVANTGALANPEALAAFPHLAG